MNKDESLSIEARQNFEISDEAAKMLILAQS